MEQYLAHSDKFDHGVMDRFLNLSELPVIGTSALEQILHQASLDFPGPAPAPTAASQSPASCSGSAMSPDSSQWTASTSGVESGSEASDSDCLPGAVLLSVTLCGYLTVVFQTRRWRTRRTTCAA